MIQLDENRPAKVAKDSHSPSIELRQQAALYHSAMTGAEDQIYAADDVPISDEDRGKLLGAYRALANIYRKFCDEQGFQLATDASGLFLRCAETNIPLVETDECVEINTGEMVLVKQAA